MQVADGELGTLAIRIQDQLRILQRAARGGDDDVRQAGRGTEAALAVISLRVVTDRAHVRDAQVTHRIVVQQAVGRVELESERRPAGLVGVQGDVISGDGIAEGAEGERRELAFVNVPPGGETRTAGEGSLVLADRQYPAAELGEASGADIQEVAVHRDGLTAHDEHQGFLRVEIEVVRERQAVIGDDTATADTGLIEGDLVDLTRGVGDVKSADAEGEGGDVSDQLGGTGHVDDARVRGRRRRPGTGDGRRIGGVDQTIRRATGIRHEIDGGCVKLVEVVSRQHVHARRHDRRQAATDDDVVGIREVGTESVAAIEDQGARTSTSHGPRARQEIGDGRRTRIIDGDARTEREGDGADGFVAGIACLRMVEQARAVEGERIGTPAVIVRAIPLIAA